MKSGNFFALFAAAALTCTPVLARQAAPATPPQTPSIKTATDEVLLDIVVRDKKGKPINDLKPDDLSITDNGTRQSITSFRLVQGAEAISSTGAVTKLDPLRQVRLVTLAFESIGDLAQRLLARKAAIDLVKGDQGTNVFYAVVMINTRLLVLQQFTNDKAQLAKAIERATASSSAARLISESDSIKAEMNRDLSGADTSVTVLVAATQAAATAAGPGGDPTRILLMRVLLDMLRMDASASANDTRFSLNALQSLVAGLEPLPGRKSILYFTPGMILPTELDVPFRSLLARANRANVTFYDIDTRGVIAGYGTDTQGIATGGSNAGSISGGTGSQNADAMSQLNAAAAASATTVQRTSGAVTKDEILASDNAETAVRSNVGLAVRDLAESTGGFVIGDSNDLRGPLRRVNEEINTYYEISYTPAIERYDGSFRKIKVDTARKDLNITARNGYFAMPPEARASGLMPYELPLFKAISDGATARDVEFRAAPFLLQPKTEGTDTDILVEVPLHGLQPKTDPAKNTLNVHFSLAALVKDSRGEVVQKVTRDRSLQVTPEQLKMGNFVEKMIVTIPPGKYSLESAVMDRESSKLGASRSEFSVAPHAKGVAISSIAALRSYTPNAKNLDPNEPFQFQGGSITPTLNTSVPAVENAMLRLFFTIYQDPSISSKATVEVEFLLNGQSLQKVPLPLPDADAQGRIPYVLTIPAAAIPPGVYQVRATTQQGGTSASAETEVKIEKM